MRGAATLALVCTDRVDPGLTEFIRLCVGFLAGGGSLTLLEVGPGRGLLSGDDDLPDDVARNLSGLADFDVRPLPVADEELRDLLRGSERVIRVASPTRPGTPELLILDDAYLESADPGALLTDITNAGQLIRT